MCVSLLELHCFPKKNWVDSTARGNETKAGNAVWISGLRVSAEAGPEWG